MDNHEPLTKGAEKDSAKGQRGPRLGFLVSGINSHAAAHETDGAVRGQVEPGKARAQAWARAAAWQAGVAPNDLSWI